MKIVISTCPRQPEYIHQVIATLLLAGHDVSQLELVIDGKIDFLHHGINKVLTFLEKGHTNRVRSTHNYIICLRRLETEGLVLEDDVLAEPNFRDVLDSAIKEAETLINGPYLISLRKRSIYSGAQPIVSTVSDHLDMVEPFRMSVSYSGLGKLDGLVPLVRQENNTVIPVVDVEDGRATGYTYFFGTQAVYFPKSFPVADLVDFLVQSLSSEISKFLNYDMLVGHFLMVRKIPYFYSSPGVFKHIGEHSQILGVVSKEPWM